MQPPTRFSLWYPLPVRVLYGVLILSTMALIWAALAVVRHIRRQRNAVRSQADSHEENL